MLTVDDFDFVLPPELIAQHPAAERSASRLLDAGSPPELVDRVFRDLPLLLRSGDLLVFNDSRVIPARLWGRKIAQAPGQPAGGAVEVLVERVLPGSRVWAHVRASKAPKPGQRLWLGEPAPRTEAARDAGTAPADGFAARTIGRAGPDGGLFELDFPDDPLALLQRFGAVPLPPYIGHVPDAQDAARYQTVYAREPGSVAAPTAGLHFDEALLARIDAMGAQRAAVTLHVGAGTFQPVRVSDLREHRMHSEWYTIPEATMRAIAAVRQQQALAAEAAGRPAGELLAGSRETALFVTPGYRFRVADALVTNFHLPRSTLLMLVSAFAGIDVIRRAYAHAVAQRYRFFSYGDAMWLTRGEPRAGADSG